MPPAKLAGVALTFRLSHAAGQPARAECRLKVVPADRPIHQSTLKVLRRAQRALDQPFQGSLRILRLPGVGGAAGEFMEVLSRVCSAHLL